MWFCLVRIFCLSVFAAVLISSLLSSSHSMFTIRRQNKYSVDKKTDIDAHTERERKIHNDCRVVEWLLPFKQRTYVPEKGGWEVSNSRLPFFSFTIWSLFIFVVVVICRHSTFHPFKWFSAADDYQLTHTDWVCSIKCKAASNPTNRLLLFTFF